MARRIDPKTVLTVMVLVGVLALALLRTNHWNIPSSWSDWSAAFSRQPLPSPEDGIYAMLDAARAGNTRAYLDCFAGPLRDQLAAAAKEDSEAEFKTYLQGENSGLQGVALMVTDRPAEDQARVRLEYVYTDHNEVQNLNLKKEGARWRIMSMDSARPIKTAIPYGTKVTD